MNSEVFAVTPATPVEEALGDICALSINGAPVVDAEHKPVGMVSWRELVDAHAAATVADQMKGAPFVVEQHSSIRYAARKLADADVHCLMVVDEGGQLVGVTSAVDLVRALVGLPAHHPAEFPHYDATTGVSWTDDIVFDLDHVDRAPDGPGLFMLVYGAAGRAETPVWAEAVRDMRARLSELLSIPQDEQPWLKQILEHDRGHLRFRATIVPDVERRGQLLARLEQRVGKHLMPSGRARRAS